MTSVTADPAGPRESRRTPAEIRADLDAVAPVPKSGDVTVMQLARAMAAVAQERWALMWSCGEPPDRPGVEALGAEFTAAMALHALAGSLPGGTVAVTVRDSLADGGEVGEWLRYLLGGEDAERITALACELSAASPLPDLVSVRRDDLRSVLADASRLAPNDPEAWNRAATAAGLLGPAEAARPE